MRFGFLATARCFIEVFMMSVWALRSRKTQTPRCIRYRQINDRVTRHAAKVVFKRRIVENRYRLRYDELMMAWASLAYGDWA
jgi:hypothetical protein